MTRIVFIDTETTSLRPDRRAWEIGMIIRPDAASTLHDVEERWFIRVDDLDLGNADPKALEIGRFYERHPAFAENPDGDPFEPDGLLEYWVMHKVERLTRGAHLVGLVPSFDAEVLAARMREHGFCPSWHHRLIDARTMAAGWVAAHNPDVDMRPPWNSEWMCAQLGVEQPSPGDQHTALGDARFARDLYDRVGGALGPRPEQPAPDVVRSEPGE
ncbi:3'-5' exonuclease [Paractinoplanes atraurantiacus]|uniref:DNA polymerase III, epsilon subunit n=1 Tax=Paractinoplanes atraurantiacus TaxID=1036182 RepID=A0A285H045_9ACTN|nr:hypothetical protein [Actinoplanes atraurantiacus]SNY28933.1 DNA polymerase III, epsilon subunit [Actinoplanes atraurantiacus]